MDTINNIELGDESVYPDDHVLKAVLADTYTYYHELLSLYNENDMQCQWQYYQDGKAWLCKVHKKKKTIIWMSAWKGYMQATIYIPLRLIEEIRALPLSRESLNRIENTRNVGKSKPCMFEIRNQQAIADLKTTMQFKMTVN